MISDKICSIIIIVAIVTITCLLIYKNKLDKTNLLHTPETFWDTSTANQANHLKTMQLPSLGLLPSTIEQFASATPTTTAYTVAGDVKGYLDSRYNEIIQGQYDNIKRQEKIDGLTDRLNTLNTELQKHVNTNLTYQASGELNFY